jgi:hypothetical protein
LALRKGSRRIARPRKPLGFTIGKTDGGYAVALDTFESESPALLYQSCDQSTWSSSCTATLNWPK